MKWWSMDFHLTETSPELAHCCAEAMELGADIGAEGTTELGLDSFRVYFNGDIPSEAEIAECFETLSVTNHNPSNIESKNWVAEASELLVPLDIGTLRITPIATEAEKRPLEPNEILILTGTGFGTGHHPTTSNCLRLLQEQSIKENSPNHILDFGTGSGILAIAAVKILGADVFAVENDLLALENTKINIDINACCEKVVLSETLLQEEFDMIIANVYAEVLIEHEPYFHAHLRKNSYLVLSGIMESKEDSVMQAFRHPQWKLEKRFLEQGWTSMLLMRIE
jgi:ribosomal protein L11 methyltransferase